MSRPLVSALGAAVILGGAFSSEALANGPDPETTTWDDLVGASPKNRKEAIIGSPHEYYFEGILRQNDRAPS